MCLSVSKSVTTVSINDFCWSVPRDDRRLGHEMIEKEEVFGGSERECVLCVVEDGHLVNRCMYLRKDMY